MAARSKTANDDGVHFSFSPIDLVAKRHVSTLSEGRDGTDSVVFKRVSSKEVKAVCQSVQHWFLCCTVFRSSIERWADGLKSLDV